MKMVLFVIVKNQWLRLRDRLYDMYKQNWNTRILESPRARFYRAVKSDFNFQKQLDTITIKSHRIAYVRLLTSSHHLRIETGRWERPPLLQELRFCDQCHKIEDEYHFLLECTKFTDLRKELIPKYYWKRPSMFKCVNQLTSNRRRIVCNLGKYIYNAFCIVRQPYCSNIYLLCVFLYLVSLLCVFDTLAGACGLKVIIKIYSSSGAKPSSKTMVTTEK